MFSGTVFFKHALQKLLITMVWIDSSFVRLLSSDPYHGYNIGTCVRTRNERRGGRSEHSRPDAIRQYNHRMGGVDKRLTSYLTTIFRRIPT